MSLDSVVDEVREARDAYAKRFNYDLQAIYRDLKEQEKKSGRKFVSLPPRHTIVNADPGLGGDPRGTGA